MSVIKRFGLFIILQCYWHNSWAINLLDAYTMARDSDPAFIAAYYAHQAGQEYRVLGRANLLPSVSASYTRYENSADIDFDNGQTSRSEQRDYTSKNASVQLRQPLINFDAYARYKQGIAQTFMSDEEYAIREQELILRVFNRYAAVLYAQDMLALATMKKSAYAEQRQADIYKFKHGESTKTDILESQSRFDLAEADIVEAMDNLNDAKAALNKIVGRPVDDITPLKERFELLPLEANKLENLQTLAAEQNVELKIQRYSLDVAKQDLNRGKAAHLPRLDGVMSWNNTVSDTTNTYNQEAVVKSLGVQLTVPIFSGGAASAQVRQAQAKLFKAKAEFSDKTNQVLLELQQQFNIVSNSKRKLTALTTAVNSAQLLVKATKKSIKAGTRTTVDVLNAESQFIEAKGDLLLARYNYLQSYLNLKKVIGTLGINDLSAVSAQFK
ncbi:hypothetical protein LCGC14_1775690 [marine sediment metagenome]